MENNHHAIHAGWNSKCGRDEKVEQIVRHQNLDQGAVIARSAQIFR
jgi:hypothetical protein